MMHFVWIVFISSFPSWASQCGHEGSLEERMKNCNYAKGEFILVFRNQKGLEIYKDIKTGLLWGDRIGIDFNHYGAQKACPQASLEAKIFNGFNWRLPTIREFELAAFRGMKDVLPRMFHSFWTSTPVKSKYSSRRKKKLVPAQAYVWEGIEQRVDIGDMRDGASVRCVAETK